MLVYATGEEMPKIMDQLKGYMEQLRNLPPPGYIGGVDSAPCADLLVMCALW